MSLPLCLTQYFQQYVNFIFPTSYVSEPLALWLLSGYGISPSPATFSTIPPIKEGPPDHANRSNAPSPASQPHGKIPSYWYVHLP